MRNDMTQSVSPFTWYGGKQRIANKIVSILPRHVTYVEVFGGSGAVLFAKSPDVSVLEVFNDLNKNVFTFFKVLRDKEKAKELVRMLDLTPYSRDMWNESVEMLDKVDDDLMRAYYFFINIEMGFSGIINNSFAYGINTKKRTRAFRNKISRLELFSDRLKYVQIENLDFAELIQKYDSEDVLFYIDPPYVVDTRRSYNEYEHELSNDRHKELVDILLNIKGNAILSGYDNDIYKPLVDAGWSKYEIEVYCSSDKVIMGKRDKRVECVWIKKEDQPNLFGNNIF